MRQGRVDDGEHLLADAEDKVAAPFDVFRHTGKRRADGPDGVDGHRRPLAMTNSPGSS